MSSEITGVNESNKFELPVVNQEFAELLVELVEGFAGPLDGEISYTKADDNGHRRAIDFFGKQSFDGSNKIGLKDIQSFRNRVFSKLTKIEEMKSFMNSHFEGALLKIYTDAVGEFELKFKMFNHAVWLEAQKGGYNLSDIERDSHLKEVRSLMTPIWGESILSSQERVVGAYEDIYDAFHRNSNNLTDKEKEVLVEFFELLETQHGIDTFQYKLDKAVVETLTGTKQNSIFEKALDSSYQCALFSGIVDLEQKLNAERGAIGGGNRQIISREGKGSYAVSHQKEVGYAPGVGERIVKQLIPTQGHETKHVRSGKNTNAIFGKGFKTRGYLGTEEAVATSEEGITKGVVQKIEDLDKLRKKSDEKTRALVVCEHYGFDESVKLIEIFVKLGLHEIGSVKTNPEARVLRSKRMGPLDIPYASTKDRAYLDGLDDVILYLKEAKSMEEMFSRLQTLHQFKAGIKDLENIEKIKEELGIEDNLLHMNYFLTRRLWRALEGLDENDVQKGSLDEQIYKIKVDISQLLDIVQSV